MKWLLFAWKNVLRNRRRSLITILLASVGVAGVLLATGFALSTYDALKEMWARQIGHVVLAHRDYFDNDEEKTLQHGLDDAPALTRALLGDARVERVLPRVQFSGLLSNGEKSAIYLGSGVDPVGEMAVNGKMIRVEQGRALSATGESDGEPEVMVAKGLARTLHTAPGTSLTLLSTTASGALNGIDVKVVGIYATGTPEMDERALMVSVATAQQLVASPRVSTLGVYLKDLDGAEAFKTELAHAHPDLALRTWEELASFYTKVRNLYDRIFGVLGIILLTMVFFAIANTMAMTVAERTREIGTLAALGTGRGRIVANFALEAGIIGILGALAGMAAAALITWLLTVFTVMMPPPPGYTDGYPLVIKFVPGLYLRISLVVAAISAFAAMLAARRGVRRPIVDALAHV